MAFFDRKDSKKEKDESIHSGSINEEEFVPSFDVKDVVVMDYADMENEVEATKITSTMEIRGNIRSKDSIYSSGKVFGNVVTTQVYSSRNLTVGDIDADTIALNTGRVKGDIKAQEKINVGPNSVVVGNVKCEDILVAGKIRGNLDIKESALIQSSSLVVGDILADNISAEQGARLNGKLTMRRDARKSTDFDAEFDLGGDF